MEITIQSIKERFHLTLNADQTKIWIYPMTQYDIIYNVLPTTKENCIEVTKDEFIGLNLGWFMLNDQLNEVVAYENPDDSDRAAIEAQHATNFNIYADLINSEVEELGSLDAVYEAGQEN